MPISISYKHHDTSCVFCLCSWWINHEGITDNRFYFCLIWSAAQNTKSSTISGQIFVVLNQQTSQRLLAEAITGINLWQRRPVSTRRPWGGNKAGGWDAVGPERRQLDTQGCWRWGELCALSTQQDWPHRHLYYRNTLSEETKVTLCECDVIQFLL